MTRDESYERQVAALELSYAATIAAEARAAVSAARGAGCEGDEVRDAAGEALSAELLNDSAWAPVAAADISDIAHGAVDEALRELS